MSHEHLRRFDHDEARHRYTAGEKIGDLAREFGVTYNAIVYVVDDEARARQRANHLEWQRRTYRQPCRCGCGRIAWHGPNRSGYTLACEGRIRRIDRHGTESMYSDGCRCDECRSAANEARAMRRLKAKPAVHGANGYKNGCRCDECREGIRNLRRSERTTPSGASATLSPVGRSLP